MQTVYYTYITECTVRFNVQKGSAMLHGELQMKRFISLIILDPEMRSTCYFANKLLNQRIHCKQIHRQTVTRDKWLFFLQTYLPTVLSCP